MKRTLLFATLLAASSVSMAQTTGSNAVGQSAADAGAMAQTGAITFEAGNQRRHTSVSTTPHVYVPPSMFGGANNCGTSNSIGIGVTGFGFGGSHASESDACNAREDTTIAARLGYEDVAKLRFFCFGEQANRLAFEAAGYTCPGSAAAAAPAAATQAGGASATSGYTGNDPIVMRRLGMIE